MKKGTGFLVGMGAGLTVGIGTAIGVKMLNNKKKGNTFVKTANKTVKAVGDIVDDIREIFD